MKWTIRNILYASLAILMLYITGVFSLYIFINPILFKTESTQTYALNNARLVEEIEIPLPEQNSLAALLCKPAEEEKAVVLFLHGANGNSASQLDFAKTFTDRGLAVLIPDFRGYGKSKGRVSETGMQEDAMASMEWLRKRYREDSIILYARDFSAPAACYLASIMPCRMLILDDPIYSLRRWMRDRFTALILPYELKYDFNTYEYLPNSICPVYILQPKTRAQANNQDARKLQGLLRDPNAMIWLEQSKNASVYETEAFQTALDQLIGY
ncbi:MAG TPA: alpha/beta fold hydrolase [Saprospiraceae bacterium]|nr:alpha/beta fold hydrolase [Saprospiraceae bacterium]